MIDVSNDSFAVVLPAAGLSTRFGRNKLAENLRGVPVFVRSVRAFLSFPANEIAAVVIAYPPGVEKADLPFVDAFDDPRLQWVPGGATRADSVRLATLAVPASIERIAIHDAARPLVSADLIRRCFAHAIEHGNASPAMPVKLTVKEAAGPLPAVVRRTLVRGDLWEMQTPQVMRRADLLAAYASCPIPLDQITDDAQLLELAGHAVWLISGEERNLKITTPTDMHVADSILDQTA